MRAFKSRQRLPLRPVMARVNHPVYDVQALNYGRCRKNAGKLLNREEILPGLYRRQLEQLT